MTDLKTSSLVKNNDKPVLLDQYGHKYVAPKSSTPVLDSTEDKAGFFAARWNKDNLWNIIFWLGTSFCVTIADLLLCTIDNLFGLFLFFLIVILSPYLLTRFNQVTYKDKMFFSSADNRALMPYLSKGMCFLPIVAIPFTIFSVLFIHDHHRYLDENFGLYNAIFWFLPTMYFIFKNCPISILFNKKVLSTPIPGVQFGVYHGQASSSGIRKPSYRKASTTSSMQYRYMSSNIYYKR